MWYGSAALSAAGVGDDAVEHARCCGGELDEPCDVDFVGHVGDEVTDRTAGFTAAETPACWMRAAVSSRRDSVRPQITTAAPSSVSCSAHAAPSPVPPPVTTTVRPASAPALHPWITGRG